MAGWYKKIIPGNGYKRIEKEQKNIIWLYKDMSRQQQQRTVNMSSTPQKSQRQATLEEFYNLVQRGLDAGPYKPRIENVWIQRCNNQTSKIFGKNYFTWGDAFVCVEGSTNELTKNVVNGKINPWPNGDPFANVGIKNAPMVTKTMEEVDTEPMENS